MRARRAAPGRSRRGTGADGGPDGSAAGGRGVLVPRCERGPRFGLTYRPSGASPRGARLRRRTEAQGLGRRRRNDATVELAVRCVPEDQYARQRPSGGRLRLAVGSEGIDVPVARRERAQIENPCRDGTPPALIPGRGSGVARSCGAVAAHFPAGRSGVIVVSSASPLGRRHQHPLMPRTACGRNADVGVPGARSEGSH